MHMGVVYIYLIKGGGRPILIIGSSVPVYREANKCADTLANIGCSLNFNCVFIIVVLLKLRTCTILIFWGTLPLDWFVCSFFLLGFKPSSLLKKTHIYHSTNMSKELVNRSCQYHCTFEHQFLWIELNSKIIIYQISIILYHYISIF
jgi:hypothetical protein